MPDWVAWAVGAAVLAAGEAATAALVLGPIALGAAIAAIVAAAGAGVAVQVVAFILASVAALAILRPIAARHMKLPPHMRTGSAALIGTSATVLEQVDRDGGRVKIGGEVWSARSYDEDEVIEPGDRVEVLKIDGATALVAK
ncbi:MAG TPA: NfeD family protein [Thermoleophilaceae bacterium]|jgi:membrane protein implicated in regulation of membrane protease activity|nr:NfeD family protein [Thermoleophilaceae bacterium]